MRRQIDWNTAMRDLRLDRTKPVFNDEAVIQRLRQFAPTIPTAIIAKESSFAIARLMRAGWLTPNPQLGGFDFHDLEYIRPH